MKNEPVPREVDLELVVGFVFSLYLCESFAQLFDGCLTCIVLRVESKHMSVDSSGEFDAMPLFISGSFSVQLDSNSEISIGCVCIFGLFALQGSQPHLGESDSFPLEHLILLWRVDDGDALSGVLLQSDILIDLVNVLIDELVLTLADGERK